MLDQMINLSLLLQEGLPTPGEEGAGTPPGGLPGWMPIVFVVGIFYLLLIRPENKRRKEQQTMLSSLSKGDRVLMSSGIFATVIQVQGNDLTLQIADGVRVKAVLSAVQQRFVDGDEDSSESENGAA